MAGVVEDENARRLHAAVGHGAELDVAPAHPALRRGAVVAVNAREAVLGDGMGEVAARGDGERTTHV